MIFRDQLVWPLTHSRQSTQRWHLSPGQSKPQRGFLMGLPPGFLSRSDVTPVNHTYTRALPIPPRALLLEGSVQGLGHVDHGL